MSSNDREKRSDTLEGLVSVPSAGVARVLLADDDRALRAAIARALGSAGFEVTAVADGNAAIEALKASAYDVLVTDINMPGTSGVDLLRLVRAYDLDMPVLLLTGEPEIDSAVDAVELGALRYLRKPVPLDELTSAVRRACTLRRLAAMKREALAVLGAEANEPGDLAGVSTALDEALATLWMAYQPIVDVGTRRVVAYEALLRSDSKTLPHPGAILDAAERLRRLPDVGRAVRSRVARDVSSVPGAAALFINLHPLDLLDAELSSSDAPLSPFASRVVFEITERTALDEVRDMEARLGILRFMGFRLAIDDLGAGYAGLTSFARLEPEFVKLDMSLVRGVHGSPVRQKLIRSMAGVCHELGLQIIAEGIEERAEYEALEQLGCRLMQGYFFGRPANRFQSVSFIDL